MGPPDAEAGDAGSADTRDPVPPTWQPSPRTMSADEYVDWFNASMSEPLSVVGCDCDFDPSVASHCIDWWLGPERTCRRDAAAALSDADLDVLRSHMDTCADLRDCVLGGGSLGSQSRLDASCEPSLLDDLRRCPRFSDAFFESAFVREPVSSLAQMSVSRAVRCASWRTPPTA